MLDGLRVASREAAEQAAQDLVAASPEMLQIAQGRAQAMQAVAVLYADSASVFESYHAR